ncbi:MAG: right-handed parallel beta-helix repeat-containing protein [Draconibacterium sp.]|nr:right-handed parallel beta-helix repeat-containing protein [Draconibacterium sp.]
MTTSKTYLMLLTFGMMFLTSQAGKVVVNPGEDLNTIINNAKGGDTILVKPGTYSQVSLSDKNFSEQKPLIVRADGSETVLVKGDTISGGSALEISNCSYIIFEGITFTNVMWGIYVKSSEHILIRNNEIYNTGQEGCHIGRSSKYVDIIGNKIHNTGLFNSKWAEGVYVGSGSYGRSNFPDNCEYIWIEGNDIYKTGNAEAVNVKSECFHITIRNNKIHDIHPGTSEQYNQAAITVEGGENSLKNNYRLDEKRDVWIENNTIENVSGGYSDWNNGIMFFGTGVYILNNTIKNCTNRGIYGNNWKNLGLQNYVHGNTVSDCGQNMVIHPELKVTESNPGSNPHSPQKWYSNL